MARKDISDKQVCCAFAESDRQRGPNIGDRYELPGEIIHRETGQPEKVCYAAMERAEDRGYLEYGVSLGAGWLTKKGKELITRD